jgi:hypothetical protein
LFELKEGCDADSFTEFNSAVAVSVTQAFLESATEAQLAELENGFLESYNQANRLNDDICDPLFRQVVFISSENKAFALN